jgi:hypothetical protein
MAKANMYQAARLTLFSLKTDDGNSQYEWLQLFDKSFDQRTTEAISSAASLESPYDIYRVEQLLGDMSELLDRCLAYRREYYDLDTQAVKSALDHDLFQR